MIKFFILNLSKRNYYIIAYDMNSSKVYRLCLEEKKGNHIFSLFNFDFDELTSKIKIHKNHIILRIIDNN